MTELKKNKFLEVQRRKTDEHKWDTVKSKRLDKMDEEDRKLSEYEQEYADFAVERSKELEAYEYRVVLVHKLFDQDDLCFRGGFDK